VIPHGAFEHLTRLSDERPLPPELAAVEGPVVLCFGVVRPYKGVDVLVDAFRSIDGAELWVVGRPLGVSPAALGAPASVRFVPRYVRDAELPAFFRRADLLVLPHRIVDVSGVLFAGLAFGKAMVLSDTGGFRELVEEHGAGRLVPPGDAAALAAAIGELLADPEERGRLAARARSAAAGPYSWDSIARRTLEVYREVLAG
jgi:glycosyltransferase involved in cell wall biosynthesis